MRHRSVLDNYAYKLDVNIDFKYKIIVEINYYMYMANVLEMFQ